MKKKEITQIEILDACLTLIQSGKASIVDCLETYPEHGGFLEPLLQAAHQAHSDLSPSGPDEGYITTTKIRILNQLHAQKIEPKDLKAKPHPRRILIRRPALAFLSLTLILIMLISGIGVTSASASALPGDSLYAVKRGVEELQLLFTIRPSKDAELLMKFSAERLQELEELLKLDSSQDLDLALQEYEGMLSRLLEVAQVEGIAEDTELLEVINRGISNHEEVLQRVLESAPLSAQKGLENAIQNSSHGKDVIQTIQEGGSPSDLAPGQEKKESENQGNPEDENRGPKPKDKTKGPKSKDETPEPQTD